MRETTLTGPQIIEMLTAKDSADVVCLPTLPGLGNGKVAEDEVLADACAKLKLLKVTSVAWPPPLKKYSSKMRSRKRKGRGEQAGE